jgi:hypothetical protein
LTTQTATAWRLLGNAWPFYFRIVPSCSSPLKLATLQPIPAAMQPGGSVVAWAELALGPYLPPHTPPEAQGPNFPASPAAMPVRHDCLPNRRIKP